MTSLPLFLAAAAALASADPVVPPSNARQATDTLAPPPLVALPKSKRIADDRDEPRFVPSTLLALGGVVLAGSAIWYFANADRVGPSLRDAGVNPVLFKIGAGLAIPIGGWITVVGIGEALEALRPAP